MKSPVITNIPLTAVDSSLAPPLPISNKMFTGTIYPQYSYTEPPQLIPWQIPSIPIPNINYYTYDVANLESWFDNTEIYFNNGSTDFDDAKYNFNRASSYMFQSNPNVNQAIGYLYKGFEDLALGFADMLDGLRCIIGNFANNLDSFYRLGEVTIKNAGIFLFDNLVAPVLGGVNSIIGAVNGGITNVVTYINQAITWGYNTFQTWDFNLKSLFNQWFSYFDMIFSGVSSGIGSVGEKLDKTNQEIADINNQMNAFEDSMFGNLEAAETNMNLDVNIAELELGAVTSSINMLITAIITPFGVYAIIFTLPFIFGILGLLLGRGSGLVGRFKGKSSTPKGGK